jgi:MOSC domain-containing protein YiiM
MQIASLNIGEKKEVNWGTKRYQTGIFKYPVDKSIYLGKIDVQNDAVIDRKYHGGIDKACYVFGANFYNYFKLLYPELDWNYGMFGENITLFDCNEKEIHLGDIFQIGETLVEVSGPREPCVKLGIRFNTQKIIKDFIEYGQSGFYLRVKKEGKINTNDSVVLVDRDSNAPTIFELFKWRYFSKLSEKQQIEKAINHPKLDPAFARNLLKEMSKIDTR